MKVICGLALVCFVLLDLGGVASNETNCAKIIFTHTEGNYMEVEEHSTASIVFQVRNDSCSHLQDEEIHVKWKKEKFDYCRIIDLTDWMDALCQCKDYRCLVNKTFSRGESPWTFSSDGDRIKDETLNVNVTYPQNVTNFTLSGNDKVNTTENGTIQAVCQWQNGNPRKRILLRHPRNQIIAEKWPTHVNDVRLSKYVFVSNTSCRDSGLYRCEVEGSGEYKSASLQIECPPQFLESAITADTVMSGQNVTRYYNLFSYINITNCTLTGPGNAQPQDCVSNKSQVSVTGTPPQLNLTLVIRDVREEDNGTWHLSVENGFKKPASIPNAATVNFTLGVIPVTTEPPPTTSEGNTSATETPSITTADKVIKPSGGMWTELMIISCVVAVAAVGLCVTITFCVYRSRKKTKGKEVSSPNGQTFGSREPLAAHNSKEDIGMIVNELYSSSEPQGESIMITNDIYEGSGDTERRSTAPALAPGYEEVKIDAGNGTVAMVSTKTTGNNAGVYANTAEADAQRKKEQEKEKNKKRPKERAPGPPASGIGEAKKNKKESNKKEKEASPSKSKAQTNTADAKTTNTAEKPEKGRNSGKKEAKPNSTEKTATTGNPTNDENKKANADASKTKPDAAKTKSDPAKTKTDASKSKPDPAKHDAPGAKADAPDTNANARTKTDANEGAASNDDQGSILVDARVPNAEGCLYGQLDFSRVKPRTTVIKDLPSTDYAEINFKAPPPPAPEN